jgi:excinuclease ABC subunit B
VKGDVLEIGPAYEDHRIIRLNFGDQIDAIKYVDPVTGSTLKHCKSPGYLSSPSLVTPQKIDCGRSL